MIEREHTLENLKYNLLLYLRGGETTKVFTYLTTYSDNIPLIVIATQANNIATENLITPVHAEWITTNDIKQKEEIETRITDKGLSYLEEEKRQEKQDRLFEEQSISMVATNKSIQDTNTSTQANFISQKKFANRSLFLAGISSVFILVTIILSIADKTPQRLQDIETQLKNQSQELKNIHISLKEINSSIEKLKKDSIRVY